MASFRLSKAAESDLSEIFEYGVFRFGVDQSRAYLLEMEQHFQLLSKHTNLGRDASELSPRLKRFNYEAHVIFYLLIDNEMLVVRVLHPSSDFERHL